MIRKNILFILAVIVLLLLFNSSLEHILRPLNIDTTINSIETFHRLPSDSIDLIALGSSHNWNGIDTPYIEKTLGISCYNYSCAWQHINTTRLFLQDTLISQSPKVVLFDTDSLESPLINEEMGGEIYYTRGLGNREQKLYYLRECFGNRLSRYITYAFPVIMFHENWREISEESFMANSNDEDFMASRGYLKSSSTTDLETLDYETMEQAPLSEDTIRVLDEIYAICSERNIRFIMYTLPYKEGTVRTQAAAEYAKSRGIEYINFFELMEELSINPSEDFKNSEHLNYRGAEKVTKYLVENYLL